MTNSTSLATAWSDTGNNGRFTYDGSQHLLYDEALAQRIGSALVASDNGGENYAAGGTVAVPGLNAGRQHRIRCSAT